MQLHGTVESTRCGPWPTSKLHNCALAARSTRLSNWLGRGEPPVNRRNSFPRSRRCRRVDVDGTLTAHLLWWYAYAMIDWSTCPAVQRDPERVSGAWVFRGTRVPVAALFENLEDGATVSDFLEWFPGITEEQARAVLDHAAHSAMVV